MRDEWKKMRRLYVSLEKRYFKIIKTCQWFIDEFKKANVILKILYVFVTIYVIFSIVEIPRQIKGMGMYSYKAVLWIPHGTYSAGCFLGLERSCYLKTQSAYYINNKLGNGNIYATFSPVFQDEYSIYDREYPHPDYKKILDTLNIEGFLLKDMKMALAKGTVDLDFGSIAQKCQNESDFSDCYERSLIFGVSGFLFAETIVDNKPEKKMVIFRAKMDCKLKEETGLFTCGDYLLTGLIDFQPTVILCRSNNKIIKTIKDHCL